VIRRSPPNTTWCSSSMKPTRLFALDARTEIRGRTRDRFASTDTAYLSTKANRGFIRVSQILATKFEDQHRRPHFLRLAASILVEFSKTCDVTLQHTLWYDNSLPNTPGCGW
jgi:hypothetical protein